MTAGPRSGPSWTSPGAWLSTRSGNLVIADTWNQRVRVVAARTGEFYGQAMTAPRHLHRGGNGTQGFSGVGGPATAAKLSLPSDVVPDAAGNLLIADAGNNRIRVVAAAQAPSTARR